MISVDYMKKMGLTEDQISKLQEALKRESVYRDMLFRERVSPSVIEMIMKLVDPDKIDLSNKDLLREKIKAEWSDLMPDNHAQIWARRK